FLRRSGLALVAERTPLRVLLAGVAPADVALRELLAEAGEVLLQPRDHALQLLRRDLPEERDVVLSRLRRVDLRQDDHADRVRWRRVRLAVLALERLDGLHIGLVDRGVDPPRDA